MRHRIYGKHLGRDKNQREALFRSLVRNLLLQETISTTEAKAKSIKGLIDRLIVMGKKDTSATRRVIQSKIPQEEVNKKLMEVAGRYSKRQSGFTRIVRLGTRPGDGAMMVKMSLIKEDLENTKKKVESIKEEKQEETVEKVVAKKSTAKKIVKKENK